MRERLSFSWDFCSVSRPEKLKGIFLQKWVQSVLFIISSQEAANIILNKGMWKISFPDYFKITSSITSSLKYLCSHFSYLAGCFRKGLGLKCWFLNGCWNSFWKCCTETCFFFESHVQSRGEWAHFMTTITYRSIIDVWGRVCFAS